jgi:hypothetical protein
VRSESICLVQNEPDDDADVDGKHRVEKVQVSDAHLLLFLGEADVLALAALRVSTRR